MCFRNNSLLIALEKTNWIAVVQILNSVTNFRLSRFALDRGWSGFIFTKLVRGVVKPDRCRRESAFGPRSDLVQINSPHVQVSSRYTNLILLYQIIIKFFKRGCQILNNLPNLY